MTSEMRTGMSTPTVPSEAVIDAANSASDDVSIAPAPLSDAARHALPAGR